MARAKIRAVKCAWLLFAPLLAHAADSGYVGSKACFGCHAEIYKSYVKTAMGRSMRTMADAGAGLPTEATVEFAGGARRYTVKKNTANWEQSEAQAGVFETSHMLAYAVGSGVNGVSYLVRRGSFLFEAPLSFYTRPAKWNLSPGYEQADLGFGRLVPQECIGCHAGRANLAAGKPGQYGDPPFAELAIGCENCHGPGEAHVRSLGKKAGTIVNPAKLAPRLAENICVNCHQTGDARVLQHGKTYADFRPGQWLADTALILKAPARAGANSADLLEHDSAMRASKCFRASGGKLSCLTCHNPHIQPTGEEAVSYFRAKCLTCHQEASCGFPLRERMAQTPPDNCVACHLPKRDIGKISHSALTNHRIPARPDEKIADAPVTEIDGLLVVNARPDSVPQLDEIAKLKAYGLLGFGEKYTEALTRLANNPSGDPFVEASLGHRDLAAGDFEAAAGHLKKGLALGEPAVYADLSEALTKLGRVDEAMDYLEKGVAANPFDAVLQKKIVLLYINGRKYGPAKERMEHYVELFPEDDFMRGLLARVK